MRIRPSRTLASALICLSLGAACTQSKNETPNTIHLDVEAKVKGLDPIQADDVYSGEQISYAYEGLLQYHFLKRPFVLEPNLAEAMPQVSGDGKTYTFKIKKGVVFHDDPCFKETGGKGRELTAEDFVYSWKRLADPKTRASGWWVLDGKVIGLNEWREEAAKGAADYSKPVEGLKALDRYTLQVKLTRRSAQFLLHMAQQYTFAVPKEAVAYYDKEFLNHAVGTGPFRLQEFNGASKIVWVRNPTFRRELYPSEGAPGDKESGMLEDAGKPLPFADRLVFQVMEESQPRWLSFLAGKLDRARVPKDSYDQAIDPVTKELKPELKAKGISLYKTPIAELTRYVLNMQDPVLGKNKLVRQAMSLAYDIPTAIQTFYNGRAIPAQGPIPPGLAGYDEKYKNPYRQHDIAKAKELLAKAGYPDGKGLPVLEYNTLSDSISRQWSEYDQKQFASIGVKIKVNTYSWPEYQAAVKNRRGQIFAAAAWVADYPDAENFLQLFYSKNGPPGSNDGSYSNLEYDKMYDKAVTLPDSPERTALYKKMAEFLAEEAPVLFMAHRIGYYFSQPWLKNAKPNQFELGKAKYMRVDLAAKK